MATIANAYVQILPSMEGMQSELQSQMEGPAGKAGEAGGQSAGSAFVKNMGKVIAALGVGKLLKDSIFNAADMEQAVGGVETLFGDSASTVIANASEAYKSAGMSATEYMQTVTGFSASLLQSLGGDTEAAASLADQALVDMADNANKMGTSMEMIQNAYSGFAKQNYTMLDNLKLGYGGTKSEMERLLADAQALTGVEYNIDNLSDVYEAIHVIQTDIGITGATAEEASSTISGSLGMVKASAQDLLTAISSGQGLEGAIQAFGESGIAALNNLIPAISTAVTSLIPTVVQILAQFGPQLVALAGQAIMDILVGLVQSLPTLIEGIGTIVQTLIPALAEQVPVVIQAIMDSLPLIIQAAIDLVLGLVAALPQVIQSLIDALPQIIESVGTGLMNALPQLIAGCVQLVIALVGALPQIIMSLVQAIPTIIQTFANTVSENWPTFKAAFTEIFNNLAANLPGILSEFWNGLVDAVVELATTLGTLTAEFISAAGEWIKSIWTSVQEAWPTFVDNVKNYVKELPGKMIEALSNIASVGSHIIEGIWNGLSAGWDWLKEKVSSIASSLFEAAKSALGIKSPSKEFAWIGQMVTEGLGEGLEDTKPIEDALSDVLDLTTGTLTPELMLSGTNMTGGVTSASGGGYVINNQFTINGAEGQDVYQIALAVRDILTDEVNETEAVYA